MDETCDEESRPETIEYWHCLATAVNRAWEWVPGGPAERFGKMLFQSQGFILLFLPVAVAAYYAVAQWPTWASCQLGERLIASSIIRP